MGPVAEQLSLEWTEKERQQETETYEQLQEGAAEWYWDAGSELLENWSCSLEVESG